jgi:hypothetical protein
LGIEPKSLVIVGPESYFNESMKEEDTWEKYEKCVRKFSEELEVPIHLKSIPIEEDVFTIKTCTIIKNDSGITYTNDNGPQIMRGYVKLENYLDALEKAFKDTFLIEKLTDIITE